MFCTGLVYMMLIGRQVLRLPVLQQPGRVLDESYTTCCEAAAPASWGPHLCTCHSARVGLVGAASY